MVERTPSCSPKTAHPPTSVHETLDEPIEQEHRQATDGGVPTQSMVEPEELAPRVSTYAAMVDSDEGMQLNYAPSNIIDGIKYARIEKHDLASELEYWSAKLFVL